MIEKKIHIWAFYYREWSKKPDRNEEENCEKSLICNRSNWWSQILVVFLQQDSHLAVWDWTGQMGRIIDSDKIEGWSERGAASGGLIHLFRTKSWGVGRATWDTMKVGMETSQRLKVDLPCDSFVSLPGIFPKDFQPSKGQRCLHINV